MSETLQARNSMAAKHRNSAITNSFFTVISLAKDLNEVISSMISTFIHTQRMRYVKPLFKIEARLIRSLDRHRDTH